MPKYNLVNPTIIGSFDSTFSADNSLIAAKLAYTELSKNFNNHVPNMHITLQKGGKKLYNFKVSEHRDQNELSFTIESADHLIDKAAEKAFIGARTEFINSIKNGDFSGGKSDDDKRDRSIDLLKEEILGRILPWITYSDPISLYWYRPLLYGSYIDWYLPSWFVSSSPYIVISNSPWW